MTTPTRPLSTGAAWFLAAAATLTMAVSYFDRQVLAVLAPTVTKALNIDEASYGWLVSAFSIAYLVGAPLSGALIDRVGARRGLLGAVLLWSVIAALHAIVPSLGVLFALRLALGIAEAPSFPGAAQAVERAMPPASRARAFGLLFTGSSFGALLAPIAASKLAGAFGWRVAFLVTPLAGLIWVPVWIAATRSPEVRALLSRPKDPTRAPSRSFGDTIAIVAHPAVVRAAILVLATAPAIGFILNWCSKYLNRVEHVAQEDMGKYLWLPPLLFDLGSILCGHAMSVHQKKYHRGDRRVVVVAACLGATMVLLLVVHGPWAIVLVCGVALFGLAGLFAILTSDMMVRVPKSEVAVAAGVTAAAQSLAYIVTNPLVGMAVDRTSEFTVPVIVLASIIVPGTLVWLMLGGAGRLDAGSPSDGGSPAGASSDSLPTS